VQDAQSLWSGGHLGISFGSINSGLPKDIVQQIIAAEKIPLDKMETRKGKVENKKNLLADLTGRVEALRGDIFKSKSARSFRELAVNISGDGLDATVDKNVAEPGTYQIEVLQLAQKSSAISNGVEDKDNTYLGVGYLQYELPNGETKQVYIDQENSSLSGIAKLINKDSENGMHANVVNSGDGSDEPWKLIITLEETGDDNQATFPNLYLVDGMEDIWFDAHRDAKDAKIKLDGFEIELPSNRSTELIPGVTIDLKKAKEGEEITLEIVEDTGKISAKVGDLVEKINNVIAFIKEQNALDESVDTSQTLGGDITLQTIESRIRSAIFANITTDWGPRRVGDLGLTFQRDGKVSLDTEKLKSKLDANYAEVAQIISGKYTKEDGKIKGFVDNLEDVVNGALKRPGGTLTSRKQGLESQIKQIDRRIESKQRQIEQKEKMLKQKFARLEETITKIKAQGNGLAGLSGAVNPVQQLG
jgi:flagellar hook-associated protein 2